MKKLALPLAAVFGATQAFAASVLDTTAKTAITTGFGNMQDTALDLLSTSWPFLLGVAAVLFAPKMVKHLIRMM